MLWRFSANNTHLYPGALLRSLDAPGESRLSTGDEVLVEFSDGIFVSGQLLQTAPASAVLKMLAYRTRHATNLVPRTWRIVPGGEPGLVRVQRRLPVT